MTLDELNQAEPARFAAVLGAVFEHAPWVAERAAASRPFPTVTALHRAMFAVVQEAGPDAQLAFLRGHPELGARKPMAEASAAEQAALGLQDAHLARLEALNAAYRERFGFPFMLCARRHTRHSVLTQLQRRLGAEPEAELGAALAEVFLITRLRLAALVEGAGPPKVSGALSTHVLNTAIGRPAEGVLVELFEWDGEVPVKLCQRVTDADGRASPALLDDGGPLRIGRYELRFHVGPYFAALGLPAADPPYLDTVPVRIGIAEPEAHYHVPLLVTPWTYTTYRGS